ncbi:MAG: hypothetical protein J5501_01305 [Ruminococcus sp.]|nr:hypothetical protein [Ruminococcus sp.]
MTQELFEEKARAKVCSLISCISGGDFESISSVAQIDPSWCSEGQTQEEGIQDFGEWLTKQLELWSEDYGTEFVVDPFDEEHLSLDPLSDGRSLSEYTPTSNGEPLDFWFELELTEEGDDLLLCFNVNI